MDYVIITYYFITAFPDEDDKRPRLPPFATATKWPRTVEISESCELKIKAKKNMEENWEEYKKWKFLIYVV